jgi:O-antigen ligase
VALVFGNLFMLITGERMAWILFFSCSVFILLGLWLEQRVNKMVIFLTMLTMIGFIFTVATLDPGIAERSLYSTYAKLKDFMNSDYGMVFRAAIEAWKENPFFGSGMHTYRQSCEQLGFLNQSGMACTHPHNLYLQIGAETGWLGLILFSLAVIAIFHASVSALLASKKWFLMTLSFSVLFVSFWPLIGGISILNNGVAALVWLGVGWVLAIGNQHELSVKP